MKLKQDVNDSTNAQRRFISLLIENCKLPDVIAQFAHIDWRERSEEAYARILTVCRTVEGTAKESIAPQKGKKIMRDDFSDEVKRITAARVGNRCSNPSCRALTSGPQVDPSKALNVGVAAHITAASPGGPRYNPVLKPEERSHFTNAIWPAYEYPVMPVIRTSGGQIRWMNVTDYLRRHGKNTEQIVFEGEPFTALNVARMRERLVR